jgi:hypothetical protein
MQAPLQAPRRSSVTGREKQVVTKLKYKFSFVRAVCTFKEIGTGDRLKKTTPSGARMASFV